MSRATLTNSMVRAAKIGTRRLPLKNERAIGSLVSWKRLYKAAAINPEMIPMKTFPIWPNAGLTVVTLIFNRVATDSGFKTLVGNSKATNPAKAAAPSLSLDIPRAKPTANSSGNCPSTALPPACRKWATMSLLAEAHQFPIPTSNAAAGSTATGSCNERPMRCK